MTRRNRRGQYSRNPATRLNRSLWRGGKRTARFIFWRIF